MRLLHGFAALLVLGTTVSACGGDGESSASRRSAGTAATRTGDAGVSVELPSGWHAGTPADGNVVDPLTRVVASSAPIRPRDVPCQIARYAPAPAAVTLLVVEWKPNADTRAGPRPQRFTPEMLELHPPPAIECFEGPGGSVQFADHGRVFGAYLLAGELAPRELIAEAFHVLNTLNVHGVTAATRRLTRNGVSIAVPTGWDGRMLFRDAAGSWGVIFQVANFRLPPNEGFEPPRELPPGQEDPIKAMDAGDVLVTISSDEATGEPAPETLTLDRLRFVPQTAPRVPRGHTLADGSFCYGERCVRIEVDFGGRAEPDLRRQVDELLASLAVRSPGDSGPRGCPRENWPGPWTACAEARWVRRVVDEGGYRVIGETGSALVAAGKGRSFYVWTTPAIRSAGAIAAEEGSSRLLVVDGIAIYGDDHLWRFWEAQGFVFWVKEGPTATSVVPSPAELTTLVHASQLVPAPPR